MATRRASATGTVRNTGNARASYTARLVVNIYNDEGDRQPVVEDAVTVALDPGETSALVDLRASVELFGGWSMGAVVVLDMVSPESRPDIDRSDPVTFSEGATYGGSWAGKPSIAFALGGRLGRFSKALQEAGTR